MSATVFETALALKFYGLCLEWESLTESELAFVTRLLKWEELERARRSLERRIKGAHLGRYKALADFNWEWPSEIDRGAISDLLSLNFIKEHTNVVFAGPNGTGKTMLAKNIAHTAVQQGFTVRFTSASDMLNTLAAQEGASALHRRLAQYCRPDLLVIDEVGYLSYNSRHADLLYEVVNRRYQEKSIIITTNKPFSEWNEVFPNATCVVTLVDRLVHHCDIISIKGSSFRLKESRESQRRKASQRAAK